MESVLADPVLTGNVGVDGVGVRLLRHRLVEGGIEDRNMREIGECVSRGVDAEQVWRVMQRRQRTDFIDGANHGLVNYRRPHEPGAALHDTVSDGIDPDLVQVRPPTFAGIGHRPETGPVVEYRLLVTMFLTVRTRVSHDAGAGPDPFDQSLAKNRPRFHVHDLVLDR